ncbi:amino acid ABC transporter membrane protein 1 (PAAT family) [Paenibacillus cellulosilyticus]|uniref:Amino acid ABC transporter membrane protein 1 (PAAT family) n=1 Tax=Paenibacillus cellulosilyticus TaxID=375489 RepID=A0A2V2YUH6_9BACL|nr:ABC transporter permease subunit [Paenibacillus cellulosilyticus]PWW03277.1 amino acid ABC transporter membrane protein 1 (PAAT family) [Paenibacillus cellulosilyticus]QKS43755.1 ABC transporter permease subunit [Paenibacillus cellulosilyticus]
MDTDSVFDLIPIFARASAVTVWIATTSIFFAFTIGLLFSIALFFKTPVLKSIVHAYVAFFRNTPSLIQAYFVFYGLPKVSVQFNSYTCSIIVLSLIGGAYMSKAIYSGIKAISTNQLEIARAMGLSKFNMVVHLIVPQALSISIAAITNNSIFLTKEVSAMKIILLPEIVYQAFAIIGLRTDLTIPVAVLTVASYLLILLPMSYLFSRLERKIRFAEFGG